MNSAREKHSGTISPAKEIDNLTPLNREGARAVWRSEFRKEPPKCLSRELLIRMLAWRIQEKAFGGHDRQTMTLLDGLARGKASDPGRRRLKPGTVLIREYQGKRHTVTITQNGFIWEAKTYPSLTEIARLITGTNWNGPRFFGLRERGAKKSQQAATT
jgi:hypothetical protein